MPVKGAVEASKVRSSVGPISVVKVISYLKLYSNLYQIFHASYSCRCIFIAISFSKKNQFL